MPIQTPIRGLRSFCISAKCLSFKQAANQLFLTPSAVSHQIKQLEEQLGIVLFERQTRSIRLTSAGKSFYKQINPIITELEKTISNFSNIQQNQTITISLPEFFASELFVPQLGEWAEQNPNTNLQLETVKSAKKHNELTDLSIVLSSSPPSNGVSHQLFPIRYLPACNKKLYKKWKNVGFSALNTVPLILHQSRPWAWHQWAEQCDIENFDPKQIIQLDSMFGVTRAAQQGMGIALVPIPIAKSWFSDQLLIKLFDEELTTRDYYYLMQYQGDSENSNVKQFMEWIISTFKDIR